MVKAHDHGPIHGLRVDHAPETTSRALERWRGRPWKRDLTIHDLLLIVVGATLAVIHHGVVLPYAHELWMKEMGL